ncbi:MAG TPA: ABC transporter permease [Candidatus Binatia bacterium]|nr:ABC transporter permease [Candidatus Binatia bacterium]
MKYLLEHPALVGTLLLQHLSLTFVSLGIALAIAIPLGIFATRKERAGTAILGVLGAIYTVPSLALLALLVPFLGLGYPTAVTALAAYAQMILVRNIVAGLRSVDPAQRDAARGLGMTATQTFFHVELPLALPVMLGGVRLALVSLIAIASIAAWINAGGLGTLLFAGIQQDNSEKIIAGSIAAGGLAICADVVLRAIERASRR